MVYLKFEEQYIWILIVSKKDIIRKANIAGPSPVGGAAGGTEGRVVLTLDEFELQAAHYNIACDVDKIIM